MDARFNMIAVVGRRRDAVPTIAPANMILEVLWSLDARLWAFSNTGIEVSRDSCLTLFCGCVG